MQGAARGTSAAGAGGAAGVDVQGRRARRRRPSGRPKGARGGHRGPRGLARHCARCAGAPAADAAALEAAFARVYPDESASYAAHFELYERDAARLAGDAHATDAPELFYGEAPVTAIKGVLDAVGARAGERFLDLGSGSGKAVIAAALARPDLAACQGIEILPSLHAESVAAKERYDALVIRCAPARSLRARARASPSRAIGRSVATPTDPRAARAPSPPLPRRISDGPRGAAPAVDFTLGNLFEADLSSADVVYCFFTCFPPALIIDVETELAARLRPGARVAVVSKSLANPAGAFEELGTCALPQPHVGAAAAAATRSLTAHLYRRAAT